MSFSKLRFVTAALAATVLLALPPGTSAQDASELTLRLERLENAIRQLTGTLEQLQFRNQQLEQQLRRVQDDNEFRFQQLGSKGGAASPARPPAAQPAPSIPPGPAVPGRRSDVFDPTQNPNAPGAPRTLGGGAVMAAPGPGYSEPPIGAPGGRAAGAPLDLSTLASNPPNDAALPAGEQGPGLGPAANSPLPPPPPRNPNATGVQTAVAPPSNTPKDEYDLGYGYVLHKDYALAEDTFRDFLKKYPSDRMAPDAQYWLGESMFQRQRYQDAADSFLVVVRNHEKSGKAPDALLRLGQSLAALGQKEMACASLGEVGRKYPRASASVKRGVEQEQKRARC
jgi:tol-pal system protein YbgF